MTENETGCHNIKPLISFCNKHNDEQNGIWHTTLIFYNLQENEWAYIYKRKQKFRPLL